MRRGGAGRCVDERGGAARRLMLRRNNRSDRQLLQEETRKSCLKPPERLTHARHDCEIHPSRSG